MLRWGAMMAVAAALGWSGSALAHPHVWIEMRSDIVVENGRVTGINVQWTFDDGYAQAALDGLDTDGDGVYSQDELAVLTKENMASLKDYDYFLHPRVDGKKVLLAEARDAGQIYSNNRLSLYFTVPLANPVDPSTQDFYYRIYDPDFFIAMDYAKDDPVTVIGALPQSCRLDVRPVVTDAQAEETRAYLATKGTDWQPPAEEDFGAMFAQPVHVACGG
jgi:ABC-type uncharacterized transport system substrate-binding protein